MSNCNYGKLEALTREIQDHANLFKKDAIGLDEIQQQLHLYIYGESIESVITGDKKENEMILKKGGIYELREITQKIVDQIDLIEDDIRKLNKIRATSIIMDKVPLPEPTDDRDGDGIPF